MAAQKLLMASIAVALVSYGVEAGSEIYELLSRMSAIGSSISDRIQDIKNKDADILILEHSLQQKSEKIAAIQSEIELWQKQAIVDAEQAVKKAHEQAFKLKNQVARLKHDIESQATKMGALEVRDNEAEKLAKELNLKLGTLQKTYENQKLIIRSTESSLHVAEEELMEAQLGAASNYKLFTEESRNYSKHYIDLILKAAKLYFEKLRAVLERLLNHLVQSLKMLVKTTLSYFNQVQVNVHDNLENHELTKPFATRKLSLLLTSAILAFPVFFLLRLLSSIFSKKRNHLKYVNRNQAPNYNKRESKYPAVRKGTISSM